MRLRAGRVTRLAQDAACGVNGVDARVSCIPDGRYRISGNYYKRGELQLVEALGRLTAECGLGKVLVREWLAPLRAVQPENGAVLNVPRAVFAEFAPGASINALSGGLPVGGRPLSHYYTHHTIPHDTARYHTIPHDTARYHTIPHDTARYHMIPHDTTRYHTIPHRSIRTHTALVFFAALDSRLHRGDIRVVFMNLVSGTCGERW